MLTLALAIALIQEDEEYRTPSIYRFPAREGTDWPERMEKHIKESGFDTLCIEPAPTAAQKAMAAKYKLKLITPKEIDTPANQKWRDATIDYANGKISPKEWLRRTANLKTTVHFLSNPKAPDLRKATGEKNSHRAVFAEMLLLSWPGRPCLTSGDIWQTRELPSAGALQSWILAMNDYAGPMLYFRFAEPYCRTQRPKIISAPGKPGLFVFSQASGKKTQTFYFNNGQTTVKLPKGLQLDGSGLNRGLIVEDDGSAALREFGNLIVETVRP
jgi:hypothetical protein